MTPDSPLSSCPKCGSAIPAEATGDICPRCLLREAMNTVVFDGDAEAPTIPVSAPQPTHPRPDIELPLPEDLAKLLPAGNYHVEGLLGQGGMGAVYKGTQIRLKRPVAIKIMHRDLGRDYDFEARFEREAQAMAKLNHPNIVSVIDFGEAGADYLYIVMEYVDGADLMDVIRGNQMTQEMALSLLPQICDALQFAHDHGIVHRDIKPSNIMLTRDGRIKMADFGLAKKFDTESSFRTQTGTGMGTPDYAAPEQFDPTANIDHRADIYALGVMIYQMITGALPRGMWKPPSQRASISPQWDEIVSRAMQSDPAERYQKASEIKTDVSSIPLTAAARRNNAATPARKASQDAPAPGGVSPRIWLITAVIALALSGFYFFGVGSNSALHWQTVDFAQLNEAELTQQRAYATREKGVLRLTKVDGWRLPDFNARNVAIRAIVRWEKGRTDVKLRGRSQEGLFSQVDSMSAHFKDSFCAIGYSRKTDGEPYLEKFTAPPVIEDGRDVVLGLMLIGSKAFLTLDGQLMGTADKIPVDAAGGASIQAVNVLVKKLEVASLDDLTEDEALQLLDLREAENPDIQNMASAQSPRWLDALTPFWQGKSERNGWRRNPDGTAIAVADSRNIILYGPEGAPVVFKDQAVRVIARLGTSQYIQLGVRRGRNADGSMISGYKVTLSPQSDHLNLSVDVPGGSEKRLADIPLPAGFDVTKSHTLEMSAKGNMISVLVDAQMLYQKSHSEYSEGYPFLLTLQGGEVERFEVANLNLDAPNKMSDQSAPPSTGKVWQDLLQPLTKLVLTGSAQRTAEGLLFTGTGSARPQTIAQTPRRDGAVRIRMAFLGLVPQIRLREKIGAGYYSLHAYSAKSFGLLKRDNVAKVETKLMDFDIATPLQSGQEYEMELRAEGTRITAKINGKEYATVTDETYTEGFFGVGVFPQEGAPTLLKSFQILNLDKLEPSDSLVPPK